MRLIAADEADPGRTPVATINMRDPAAEIRPHDLCSVGHNSHERETAVGPDQAQPRRHIVTGRKIPGVLRDELRIRRLAGHCRTNGRRNAAQSRTARRRLSGMAPPWAPGVMVPDRPPALSASRTRPPDAAPSAPDTAHRTA